MKPTHKAMQYPRGFSRLFAATMLTCSAYQTPSPRGVKDIHTAQY
jgi:hypothetical protein